MSEIDELDLAILDLLTEDSRLSYREMAKKLGISHANVSSRIKRLEDDRIIRGYTIVTDPEILDLYPLCIRISAQSGTDLSEIGRSIAGLGKTKVVVRVSGECELLALAMCNDRKEAIELLKEVSMISGIEKAESHVVLESIKLSGRNLK